MKDKYKVLEEIEFLKEEIVEEIGEFKVEEEANTVYIIGQHDIKYKCYIGKSSGILQIKEVGYEGLF